MIFGNNRGFTCLQERWALRRKVGIENCAFDRYELRLSAAMKKRSKIAIRHRGDAFYRAFFTRFRFYEANASRSTSSDEYASNEGRRELPEAQLTGNVSLNDKRRMVDCRAAAERRGTIRFQFYYASCGR